MVYGSFDFSDPTDSSESSLPVEKEVHMPHIGLEWYGFGKSPLTCGYPTEDGRPCPTLVSVEGPCETHRRLRDRQLISWEMSCKGPSPRLVLREEEREE